MADFSFMVPREYNDPEGNDAAIRIIENYLAGNNGGLITYKELCRRVGFPSDPRHIEKYLGFVSFACRENGLPLLSALVVNEQNMIPGDGFFKAYFPGRRMKENEKDELFMQIYNEIREYPHWDKVLEVYRQL